MTLDPADVLDLRQLNTFISIVEHGSFSAAARRLGISQPSVSQQIRRLEERLGRPFFARGGSAKLTPDGEALLVYARALVSLSEQVRAHFSDPGFTGRVRIGFNEDFALTVLPKVLFLFMKMHANIQLVIICDFDSEKLFRLLDEGELDLVVAKMPSAQTRGEVVRRVSMVWLGQNADMQVRDDPVPLITATAPDLKRKAVYEALAAAGRSWAERFRSCNLAVLDAAVSAGIGVAVSLKGFRMISAKELGPDCGLPPLGDMALCLDAGARETPPTVAVFADFLRKTIVELDLSGDSQSITSAYRSHLQ